MNDSWRTVDTVHASFSGWISWHSKASIMSFFVNHMHSLYLGMVVVTQFIAAVLRQRSIAILIKMPCGPLDPLYTSSHYTS